MRALDLVKLIASPSLESPYFEHREYGVEMLELEAALQGRPEARFGAVVIPAVAPDWKRVEMLSLAMCERAPDLRAVLALLRARTRRHGLAGYSEILGLLQELVRQRWGDIYPPKDNEYEDGPLVDADRLRCSLLQALDDPAQGLGDLLAIQIGRVRCADVHALWRREGVDPFDEFASARAVDGSEPLSAAQVVDELLEQEARQAGVLDMMEGLEGQFEDLEKALRAERVRLPLPKVCAVAASLRQASGFARGNLDCRPAVQGGGMAVAGSFDVAEARALVSASIEWAISLDEAVAGAAAWNRLRMDPPRPQRLASQGKMR